MVVLGLPRSLVKYCRRCKRDIFCFRSSHRGATIVEFALIAPAFLATLIAVLETTIFLFAQQTLQTAALQAGRQFMTGQAQNSGMTQSQFMNIVCPMIQALFTCSSVMVDVQSYTSFAGANASQPQLTYNAQGQVTNNWSYNPGTPGQVVIVRLIYQWPVVGGPLGFALSNLSNGKAEMMGVTAFRVEPYR
jgi:Flp pilus assembly protein TadG